MSYGSYEIVNRNIRETIRLDEKDLIEVNISYPEFIGEGKALKKINAFYESVSKEYYVYAVKRLTPVAKKAMINEETEKFGAVIKYYISFSDKKYLSVLMDISLFDGKVSDKTRRAQIWSLKDGSFLSVRDFIKPCRKNKQIILDTIKSTIQKSTGKKDVYIYYDNAEKVSEKAFDFYRFYLTYNGYAFYYPNGILSSKRSSFPVFIVPYDKTGLDINKDCQIKKKEALSKTINQDKTIKSESAI